MKTVVSGKRTVEYVKPSKRELENELMDYLNTKGVHIDKDVWDETVDYILSFWDEQDYKPRDTYEAINDWYNDTKKFFPEMFGKGRKVASARYLRWIKNQKLIKSAKTKKVNKRKTADERAKDEGADITCSRKPIKSMSRSYLKPEYDSRASFYNKAETEDDKLYSYGTLVAEIVNGKPVLYDDWDYSQTTIRHVKEFLRQHGFNAESKSQIARDYLTNSRKPIKSSKESWDSYLGRHEDVIKKFTEICYDVAKQNGTDITVQDYPYEVYFTATSSSKETLEKLREMVGRGTLYKVTDPYEEDFGKYRSGFSYMDIKYFIDNNSPVPEDDFLLYNSRKNQKIKNSYNCNRSKRMIKSGRNEKIMQAYDTADYIYENIMNRGQMYDKWFINKPQYAQDAAYICVEHTDFSVRLWFEFTNTDFCYVTGYFTNGSSYDKQVIDSWSYGDFETTLNDVKSYLDNFFEIGGGLDSLRQKLGE